MALFKILRGPSSELANLPINDGYCYFTPDTGLFHIDYNGNRVPLNSKDATTIAGASLVHVLSENGSQLEIPSTELIAELSKNLIASIAGKQDKVSGEEGQLLGFDVNGQLVAINAASGSNGLIDQNTGELIKIWHGTTAEYENLEEKDDNTIYILTDELGGSIAADSIEYYNGISDLGAKTVQEALDEIATTAANASDLTSHTENKSNPHGVTAAQVGAVPITRTVNGKALNANITLSASDVGAPTVVEMEAAIDTKAALASPTFTGTPTAPTASADTNTTQIATTAFVQTAIESAFANIAYAEEVNF